MTTDVPGPGSRAVPALHVITDAAVLERPEFPAVAAAVLRAGGPALALHVRAPGAGGGFLHRRALGLIPGAEAAGARVLVNDRVDVAACAGAHGVHLGQRSLDPVTARILLGPAVLVGVSVHSAVEARGARGADFLVVGTLFETPSHPGRPGAGPELLGTVQAAMPGLPLVGIGGVTPERVPELRGAGAAGVAVLRGIWDAASPAGAVERYLTQWQKSR